MSLSVLHLEDSALDAELVEAHLRRSGLDPAIVRVDNRDDFAAALAEPRELILADYLLPDFDGVQALRLAGAAAPDTPFIFVSGTLGEELAIESLKQGATDYVLKQNLARLGPSVERALAEARLRRERHAAEAQLRVLVAELSHRVGNILAVVQSIARQTIASSPDLRAFEKSYLARIESFARTHNLLVQSDWRGASIEAILRHEFAAFGGPRPRWSLEGPFVGLKPNAALTLALIFHELVTNAARHGALSAPGGSVAIGLAWQAGPDEGPRLRITWREDGGPPALPPTRKGFGTRLIAQTAKSLGGSATFDHGPQGLRCVLELGSAEIVAGDKAAEPDAAPDWRDAPYYRSLRLRPSAQPGAASGS